MWNANESNKSNVKIPFFSNLSRVERREESVRTDIDETF